MTEHINTISRLPNELCPAFMEWCVRGGHEIKVKKTVLLSEKAQKLVRYLQSALLKLMKQH